MLAEGLLLLWTTLYQRCKSCLSDAANTFRAKPIGSDLAHLGHGVQQQNSLSPGCIDFLPLHWTVGGPAQSEATDGTKGPITVDVEDAVQDIRGLQALQVIL